MSHEMKQGKWNKNVRFKTGMLRAAEEVCGRNAKKIKPKRTPWWNEQIAEVIRRKNKA
jgi:hypothetical protein